MGSTSPPFRCSSSMPEEQEEEVVIEEEPQPEKWKPFENDPSKLEQYREEEPQPEKEEPAKKADDNSAESITKYTWADGSKNVSIYIELDGLDEVPDEAFSVTNGPRKLTLRIASVQGKRRVFRLQKLHGEIAGVKVQVKRGKNTVVLKLAKKDESRAWHMLCEPGPSLRDSESEREEKENAMEVAGRLGGSNIGGAGPDITELLGFNFPKH